MSYYLEIGCDTYDAEEFPSIFANSPLITFPVSVRGMEVTSRICVGRL